MSTTVAGAEVPAGNARDLSPRQRPELDPPRGAATPWHSILPGAAVRVAFWGLALLAAAWAVASLWWPMGVDLGLYSWVAMVIREGGLQYRDACDMHGPLSAYLVALADLVFGRHPAAIRALDLIFLAAGSWGLARIVASVAGREMGRWAAVVFVLTYGTFSFIGTAQPDGWTAMIALAAFSPALIALAHGRRPGVRTFLIAGVTAGAFALIKPFYGLFVLVPLTAGWWAGAEEWRDHGSRSALRLFAMPAAILAASSMAVVALALVWFAAQGALDELLDVHVWYSSLVYGGTSAVDLKGRISGISDFILRGRVVAVSLPLVIAGCAMLLRDDRRGLLTACLIWLGIAVGTAVLQNKFWHYHWVPTYPPLFILGAIGAAGLLREPRRSLGRVIGIAAVMVVLVHSSVRPAMYAAQWGLYIIGRHSAESYYGRFEDATVFPAAQRAAARHLIANTSPDEGLAVWGPDAGLLYLTNRPTPFRLAGWYWPMTTGFDSVRFAYRREYLDSFERTPPRYVIVNNTQVEGQNRFQRLENFPEFDALLRRDFALDTVIGPLTLLRRRDP